MGGIVLDECIVNPTFQNADYWFSEWNTIAELKCLSENYFDRANFSPSLSRKYNSWIERGLVPPLNAKTSVVDLRSVPRQCAEEVIQPLKRKLESSTIRKANRQIRETREYLGAPSAKGLLLLVNDGNYALPPAMVRHLVSRILKSQHRCINGVVHFSVNEAISVPGVGVPALFWAEWGFPDRKRVDANFLEALRAAWFQHHAKLSQGDVYELVTKKGFDLFEETRFVDPGF